MLTTTRTSRGKLPLKVHEILTVIASTVLMVTSGVATPRAQTLVNF